MTSETKEQIIARLCSYRDRLEAEVTRLSIANRDGVVAAVFKACTCCGAKHTAAGWIALPLVGMKPDLDDNDRPIVLEFRNCRCGSTLAIESPSMKEPKPEVERIDPRDACLDEIAELCRGEVGADEVSEITRIVESSGRKI